MEEFEQEKIREGTSGEAYLPSDKQEAFATTEHKPLPIARQLLVLGGLLTLMFVAGGTSLYLSKGEGDDSQVDNSSQNVVVDIEPRSEADITFADVDLIARSAVVVDANNGQVLFAKEPDLSWPLASITKLMTALVAREIVEDGTFVPITANALLQSGNSGLSLGERFSYHRLSDLILLTSSNEGAYALAAAAGSVLDSNSPDAAFVKAMNVRAKELGLQDTNFRNPTGLDLTETEAGSYGTARDVAELMEYILKEYPEILEETTRERTTIVSSNGGTYEAQNTNRIVNRIATVLGSKTGYTTLAGGNLVVAFDVGMGRPVIAVVLGSSHQGRFSDMLQLVEAAKSERNK